MILSIYTGLISRVEHKSTVRVYFAYNIYRKSNLRAEEARSGTKK